MLLYEEHHAGLVLEQVGGKDKNGSQENSMLNLRK